VKKQIKDPTKEMILEENESNKYYNADCVSTRKAPVIPNVTFKYKVIARNLKIYLILFDCFIPTKCE
jgi:hypothetical protein